MVIKKSLVLAASVPEEHAMRPSSSILIYWISLLVLVVMNMLVAGVVAVLQLAIGSEQLLIIVAILGLFFGYITSRLVTLVENLEARHHFFAHVLVPAAAMLNLLVISMATNRLSSFVGLGSQHNPWLVSIGYTASFVIASVAATLRFMRPTSQGGEEDNAKKPTPLEFS